LRTNGFAFDVKFLLEARRRGLHVRELPIRWADDRDARADALRASAQMTADVIATTLRRQRGAAVRGIERAGPPCGADWNGH